MKQKHYYSHFSNRHVKFNNKIVIFGLSHLEYFDLKLKKIFKYGKFQKGKRGKSV